MANTFNKLAYSITQVLSSLNWIIPKVKDTNTYSSGKFVTTKSDSTIEASVGFSSSNPAAVSPTGSPGSADTVSRGDHSHPADSTRASLVAGNQFSGVNQFVNTLEVGNSARTNRTFIGPDGDITQYGTAKIIGVAKEVYNQIAEVTVTNNTVETSLLSGLPATRTINANSLSAGDIIIFEAMGTLSTFNNSQLAQVKLLFNATDLLNSSAQNLSTSSALSNDLYVNRFYIKIISTGATGSARCLGYTMIHPGTGIVQPNMREIVGPVTTINTTVDIVIDQTYTWTTANAGNSITSIMVHIEKS